MFEVHQTGGLTGQIWPVCTPAQTTMMPQSEVVHLVTIQYFLT